jgi:hypothetical protein
LVKSAVCAALACYPLLDSPKQPLAMPFAAMPEQVGVEGIFGMCDLSEVQVDAALLLRVMRVAITYRALGYHGADFLLEPLPGFH